MIYGSLWFITAQTCLLHPSCSHGLEEKAVNGGILSNAFGIEKGSSQTSSPFGALVHIYFISVVWRKEGSGYVEV